MSKISAVEIRLRREIFVLKSNIQTFRVQMLRLEKTLHKCRVYALSRGNSMYITNRIAQLEKDWANINRMYVSHNHRLHYVSAAFCQAREVRRGKSKKSIESILAKSLGM